MENQDKFERIDKLGDKLIENKMTQQVESKRRQETMRFFNMLNEPERSQAIENYDESYDPDTPTEPYQSVRWGFDWEKTPQGQGMEYWDNIDEKLKNGTYNFKTEPMEQQSDLDYQISVMQAKKDKKPILKTRNWQGTEEEVSELMGESESFNFVDYYYEVKPEPPQPKTEKFTFADRDFLFGLKCRTKNELCEWVISRLSVSSFEYCFKAMGWDDIPDDIEYQDRTTKEWKPFLKVIE